MLHPAHGRHRLLLLVRPEKVAQADVRGEEALHSGEAGGGAVAPQGRDGKGSHQGNGEG